jgi:hypothetical protein
MRLECLVSSCTRETIVCRPCVAIALLSEGRICAELPVLRSAPEPDTTAGHP